MIRHRTDILCDRFHTQCDRLYSDLRLHKQSIRTSSMTAAGVSTSQCSSSHQQTAASFLSKGLQIPQMGLGLAALGRPGYINLGHHIDLGSSKDVEVMRQHCWAVLDQAWALGVRYFDAARSYGLAEDFLGSWLRSRHIPPHDVVIGSKWGYYYTADWQIDTQGKPHEVKLHTAEILKKQAAETIEHLGDYLDLYQIHSATLESGVLDNTEVLQTLAEHKSSRGWQLGLSVSGDRQADVIQKALECRTPDGQLLFDSVQPTWNLLEQSAGATLLAAHQAGLSVIVKEAMANGRLSQRNTDSALQDRLNTLQQLAEKYESTTDALSLACVLKQPFHPMVLSGAATVEHLKSNFAAMDLAQHLSADDLQQLQQQMMQPPQDYWQERAQLVWN